MRDDNGMTTLHYAMSVCGLDHYHRNSQEKPIFDFCAFICDVVRSSRDVVNEFSVFGDTGMKFLYILCLLLFIYKLYLALHMFMRVFLKRTAVDRHISILRSLLEIGSDVNARDEQQQTPLMIAVQTRCSKLLQVLMDSTSEFSSKFHSIF